mgnify:CR=1 FL=1
MLLSMWIVKAPPSRHTKIHIDAAHRKRIVGTAVAVCRDAAGTFLGSSTIVIGGVDDPAILETIACRRPLRWHKTSANASTSMT